MHAPIISYLYFLRDLLVSLVGLPFGRLFPTLKPPPVDLTGKVAIITGGNSGIGLQIALDIARQGATVYLACRNVSKAEEAVSQIVSQVPASQGRIKSLALDTSSFDSLRAFARNWEILNTKIDILFHNAGIGSAPSGQKSADGFPMVYATNFLGSFLLTYLLESQLSSDARIIMTSSTGQYSGSFSSSFSLNSIKDKIEPGFHAPAAMFKAGRAIPDGVFYSQTKTMQAAFAKLLQDHFDRKATEAGVQSRRIAHAFSPGFTSTPIFGKIAQISFFEDPVFWLLKMTDYAVATDVSQGAATGVWLASTNDEAVVGKGMGGGYWDRMTRKMSKVDVTSKDTLERLWVRWEADARVEWR